MFIWQNNVWIYIIEKIYFLNKSYALDFLPMPFNSCSPVTVTLRQKHANFRPLNSLKWVLLYSLENKYITKHLLIKAKISIFLIVTQTTLIYLPLESLCPSKTVHSLKILATNIFSSRKLWSGKSFNKRPDFSVYCRQSADTNKYYLKENGVSLR